MLDIITIIENNTAKAMELQLPVILLKFFANSSQTAANS
jgi:hypothetical protein